jgi:hypothetical protein
MHSEIPNHEPLRCSTTKGFLDFLSLASLQLHFHRDLKDIYTEREKQCEEIHLRMVTLGSKGQ